MLLHTMFYKKIAFFTVKSEVVLWNSTVTLVLMEEFFTIRTAFHTSTSCQERKGLGSFFMRLNHIPMRLLTDV